MKIQERPEEQKERKLEAKAKHPITISYT